ncbi:response regulator [Rhizobium sp.]|jgi:two-component sensor histidine kinase|uniref:sensor histidine kinase n=1 Tax=Rhizobium sp. TaxID=391 RepID=UPI000E893AF8|nr:two-component system sensor histidine kinase/response regulator [Rhizobium sp.]
MDLRILHIDDDFALAQLLKKKLARRNCIVAHRSDADAALLLLQQETFDVVILDHYLENITGHDVLERMRQLEINVPVIYITGSNEARVAIDAIKAGAADYVIKSVHEDFFDLLEDAIQQTVSTARLKHEKELADDEIRRGKERAEMLLAEMNHRVANSLALVAGLLRLQAGSTDNEQLRQALTETQNRISAIAGMHRSLYTYDNVSHVEMNRYLLALIKDISGTVGSQQNGIEIIVEADSIQLPADKAVSAGMIVTELVTNALKYAYPEETTGKIVVSLKRQNAAQARLAVEDFGVGINSHHNNTSSTGLGHKIIKSMADTIGSGIQYPVREKGAVAEVMVNLSTQTET